MRDIRAVITDLDGTVLDRDKQLSPATVRAAGELAGRGIPLIIATARTPTWVAGLEALIPLIDLAVCCGGAVGWSPEHGGLLWQDTIPPESVDRIVRLTARHLPDAGLATYDGERWQVTEMFASHGPFRRGPVEVVAAELLVNRSVCAMSVCHVGGSHDGLLHALVADVEPLLTVEPSAVDLIDIAPAGTDKAAGVTRALAAVGVDPGEAIAFGDMLNDLPMFAVCGYSVAVANAHPDVIAAATDVTACVHDDGFARKLGDLGLVGAYREDERWRAQACSCRVPEGTRC